MAVKSSKFKSSILEKSRIRSNGKAISSSSWLRDFFHAKFSKKRDGERGQAAIEMALSLPFLIWLIFYTINGFYSLHTAHVAQKYAAMNLWQRVNNRSKFVMDDVAGQLHNREFMAVRYTEPDGTLPRRRINAGSIPIFNIVGVCREPGCTR